MDVTPNKGFVLAEEGRPWMQFGRDRLDSEQAPVTLIAMRLTKFRFPLDDIAFEV